MGGIGFKTCNKDNENDLKNRSENFQLNGLEMLFSIRFNIDFVAVY